VAGVLLASLLLTLLSTQSAAPASASPISFDKDVKPVLEQHCLSCHGETMQSGKFDLRSRDSALKGGRRGSDLVPGDAAASRLYRRVAGLERPSMPAQAEPLPAEQIAAIKQWIDEGAAWGSTATLSSTALEHRTITPEERNYWAFKLPVKAPLPAVAEAT
jgi:mono/diheme cytochrome c family protein